MKDFLKGIYYKIQKPSLKQGYNPSFGFIFHTERIYDTQTFLSLLEFCIRYQQITGKRPLCAVMSPLNKRVKSEMEEVQFSLADFNTRLVELSGVSDIGYHGHFWRSEGDYSNAKNQIRDNNYLAQDSTLIDRQFTDDYSWLKHLGFVLPYYTAGWWFVNSMLLNKLQQEEVIADFSFSFLNWVSNDWSKNLMRTQNIHYGESFQIDKLTCVQTLMGCPNTDHPEDFTRILNGYLDFNTEPAGMIATHDYNLVEPNNFNRSVQLIEYLSEIKSISFLSAKELIQKPNLRGKQKIQL